MSFDFDRLALGRGIPAKSMLGTDFVIYPDALVGECRLAILPGSWYARASTASGRRMIRQGDTWLFITTREQLAADLSETIRQLEGMKFAGDVGTVADVRVRTLQRLVQTHEWNEAVSVVTKVDKTHRGVRA